MDLAIVELVAQKLDSHPNRCLMIGAEGRGKTILTWIVAKRFTDEGWYVCFLDIQEVEEGRLSQVCSQLRSASTQRRVLFVIENAHYSEKIAVEILETIEEFQNCAMLVTSRRELEAEDDPFTDIETEVLGPNLSTAEGVMLAFDTGKGRPSAMTKKDAAWLNREFRKPPVNLRRLMWYLEAADSMGCRPSDLKVDDVQRRVWGYYSAQLIDRSDKEALFNLLCKIAAVSQFDVGYYARDHELDQASELERLGIVTRKDTQLDSASFSLEHSTDSRYLLAAAASERYGESPVKLTENVLNNYLIQKPSNIGRLLRALEKGNEVTMLSAVFGKATNRDELLRCMAEFDSLETIADILSASVRSRGQKLSLEFWRRYVAELRGGDSSLTLPSGGLNNRNHRALGRLFLSLDKISREALYEFENLFLVGPVDEMFSNVAYENRITISRRVSPALTEAILCPADRSIVANFVLAQAKTRQLMLWFNTIVKIPAVTNYVGEVLASIIHDSEQRTRLINRVNSLSINDRKHALQAIRRINPEVFHSFRGELAPIKASDFLSVPLSRLNKFLRHFRWTHGQRRKELQNFIGVLARDSLASKISRCADDPESRPIKQCAWLISASRSIIGNSKSSDLRLISELIAANLQITSSMAWDAEALGVLLSDIRSCNEEAWKQLSRKVLDCFDVGARIDIPLEAGMAQLICSVHSCDVAKGLSLFDRLYDLGRTIPITSLELEDISCFIELIPDSRREALRDWIERTDGDSWRTAIDKAHPRGIFRLLWNLEGILPSLGASLAKYAASAFHSGPDGIKPAELPLIGYLAHKDLLDWKTARQDVLLTSPRELNVPLIVSEFAMLVWLAKKYDAVILEKFVANCARWRFFHFHERDLIECVQGERHFGWRDFMSKMLSGIEFPPEPFTTLVAVHAFSRECFRSTKRTELTFGTLAEKILDSSFGMELGEREKIDAWLSLACDFKVLLRRDIPSERSRNHTVCFVSPNPSLPLSRDSFLDQWV